MQLPSGTAHPSPSTCKWDEQAIISSVERGSWRALLARAQQPQQRRGSVADAAVHGHGRAVAPLERDTPDGSARGLQPARLRTAGRRLNPNPHPNKGYKGNNNNNNFPEKN